MTLFNTENYDRQYRRRNSSKSFSTSYQSYILKLINRIQYIEIGLDEPGTRVVGFVFHTSTSRASPIFGRVGPRKVFRSGSIAGEVSAPVSKARVLRGFRLRTTSSPDDSHEASQFIDAVQLIWGDSTSLSTRLLTLGEELGGTIQDTSQPDSNLVGRGNPLTQNLTHIQVGTSTDAVKEIKYIGCRWINIETGSYSFNSLGTLSGTTSEVIEINSGETITGIEVGTAGSSFRRMEAIKRKSGKYLPVNYIPPPTFAFLLFSKYRQHTNSLGGIS